MVFFNYATMQMAAKIVYYGPGLCGKTTNLHWIYAKTAPQSRGEMVSLETETDRTLFFDLLPLDVGVIGGFKTRLQLYTIPGQVFYNTTRKLVLKGVDGVVFVADLQRAMLEANVESFRNLRENLAEIGLELDDLPVVMQLNKKDLPNTIERETLLSALDPEGKYPSVEAAAVTGEGVFETLKEISKLTLRNLRRKMMGEESGRVSSGRGPAISAQIQRTPSRTGFGTGGGSEAPAAAPAALAQPLPSSTTAPAAVASSLHAVEARGDYAARETSREENPFPDVGYAEEQPEAQATAVAVEEAEESETDRAAETSAATLQAPVAEQEAAPASSRFDGDETQRGSTAASHAEPQMKRVKLRSTSDIMRELDAIRRQALEPAAAAGPELRSERRSLVVGASPDSGQATSLKLAISFEDDDGNVLQREEQTIRLESFEDVQNLLVKLKIDFNR